MNCDVNNDVRDYMNNLTTADKTTYNSRCANVIGWNGKGPLTGWDSIKSGVYHSRLNGDLRLVGKRDGFTFTVLAIYKHGPKDKGKSKVVGENVPEYG